MGFATLPELKAKGEKAIALEGDSTAVTSPRKGIEEAMIKKELV